MKHPSAVVLTLVLSACGTGSSSHDEPLTSHSAIFLELSFEGRAVMTAPEDDAQLHKSIEMQLFYMAGELDKQHHAHGRFGFVELSNVTHEPYGEGLELVHYAAKLSVAWPQDRGVPESYRVVVPLHVDEVGLEAFNDAYVNRCVPSGRSKYGAANTWYDFQPVATGCALDPGDVVDVVAEVAPNPHVTTDRYPEQARFWDDGAFRIVLVHGTHTAESADPDDGLVQQYLGLQRELVSRHPEAEVLSGETSSHIYDDWTLRTVVPAYGGGTGELSITTLLTSPLSSIGDDFDVRFDELTAAADLVIYGGHSGLSRNIKAIAQKGVVTAGHYQVLLLQGCSTFAYLDRSITDRRIAVNGADIDPSGTLFLDLIVTAQPAYFSTNVPTFLAAIETLGDDEAHSYLSILEAMPQSALPVVAGEEDNPSAP